MHVLITGASGIAGRFIVEGLEAAGHRITRLGRHPGNVPWSLADLEPRLPPADALVHAAFHHAPGAYRGGEGDDPQTFLRLNQDGSQALFAAARDAGIPRTMLLSSRAVYGDHRRGEILEETDPLVPDSLYGEMKAALERSVLAYPGGIALRATGLYGQPPGAATHKWADLFGAFLAGAPVTPRQGTELHGADLAGAVACLLKASAPAPGTGLYNASDLLLDRRDLLDRLARLTACAHPLPPRASGPPPGVMATDRLRRLGWRPGGLTRLEAFLEAVASPPPAP